MEVYQIGCSTEFAWTDTLDPEANVLDIVLAFQAAVPGDICPGEFILKGSDDRPLPDRIAVLDKFYKNYQGGKFQVEFRAEVVKTLELELIR